MRHLLALMALCVAFAAGAQFDCSLPGDLTGDSLVTISDLTALLAYYGNDYTQMDQNSGCAPVTYHGYTYDVVQIGEQCWFAENLRTELYQLGEEIPSGLNRESWAAATYGATSFYGETADSCVGYSTSNFPGNPCDNPEGALEFYGRLYNWHAVNDARGLCPTGWHVPASEEWIALETYVEASYPNHSGLVLREHGSWHSPVTTLDLFGFNLRPAGYRSYWDGEGPLYQSAGKLGTWFWTADEGPDSDEGKSLSFDHRAFNVNNSLVIQSLEGPTQNQHQFGFSVRCIKDAE